MLSLGFLRHSKFVKLPHNHFVENKTSQDFERILEITPKGNSIYLQDQSKSLVSYVSESTQLFFVVSDFPLIFVFTKMFLVSLEYM